MDIIKRNTFQFILLTLGLIILTTLIRYIDLDADIIVSFIIFALVFYGYIKLKKNANAAVLLFVGVATIVIIFLILGITEGEILIRNGQLKLPLGTPNILAAIFGYIGGFVFAQYMPNRRKWVLWYFFACTLVIVGYFTTFKGYWLNYYTYDNSSGLVDLPLPLRDLGVNVKNDTFKVSDYNGKTTVLEFWNTRCFACIKEFPEIEQLHKQIQESVKDIQLISVNLPTSRDTAGTAFELVKRNNNTFPLLVAFKGIDTLFGVEIVPTTLIVKDNRIIYWGNLIVAKKILNL